MRDFDLERRERYEVDRTFRIGGETFVRKPAVRPEVMLAYEDMSMEATAADSLEVVDQTILSFIEDTDGAHDRYRALRERDEDPVSIRDLNGLVVWLIAESTKRPTSALSLSEPGREPTGTTSKETSSTEPAEASAA